MIRRGITIGILAGLAFLGGCLQLSKPTPPEQEYRLDYPPPSIAGESLPVVVRIAPVRVAALLDRAPLMYALTRHKISGYHYHRWSAPPGEMAADLLARDLATSALYRAVQQGPSVLVADYQVDAVIDHLEEQNESNTCRAVLVMRVQAARLRVAEGDPVVMQRTYRDEQPVACHHPAGLAAALSQVFERISSLLQRDLHQRIAADLAAR